MRADYDFETPVTLVRERLPSLLSPTQAVLHLRGEERPFALLGAWLGGGALLGSRPVAVVEDPDAVFAALDRQPPVTACDAPPGTVGGGWVGYLGFSLGARAERLDPPPPAPCALPAGSLAFYDHLVRCDTQGRWWFEALLTPAREAAIATALNTWRAALGAPGHAQPFATGGWQWCPRPEGHAEAVELCRERIRAGDLFQANLAMRLDGRLEGDPLDVFAVAAQRLATDRAAYLAGPWGALASLSPELFLSRHGREVRSAPIKGTRPVGRAHELHGSAKDRAENVMIVDLMRNDLGRVCAAGSVHVPALAQLRPHAGVWHLVSEMSGRLRDGVGDAELMRATFPPGSVTGAPKIAAVNVISELESTRREAYTGAIGFASPLGTMELSVAIRTFEFAQGRAWLGAGGGIVADSDGTEEAGEAAAKAKPLLAAIGADLPGHAPVGTRPPRFRRLGPRPVPRPDPAAGIYETVRVVDGLPRRWPAHLARLTASLATLYDRPPPADLGARVAALAAGTPDGRIRVDVSPGEEARLTLTPNPVHGEPVLRPVRLAGGLGPHKWRDRTLLEALEGDDPATLPLLVDADGFVLETSRTAVVVQSGDGRLWTPPTDGRILASVTATAYGAHPRRLTLEDLAAARAVFVASALRELAGARLMPTLAAAGA